ncbi:MAG: hypothetical protein RLZZ602_684 [Pseudomonadota bacterium]
MVSIRNQLLSFSAAIVVLSQTASALAQETVDFVGAKVVGGSVILDTNGDMVDDLIIASESNGPLVVESSFTANFVYSEMPILSHPAKSGPELRLTFLHGLSSPLELGFSSTLRCPKPPNGFDLSVTAELFTNNTAIPVATVTVPASCFDDPVKGASEYVEGRLAISSTVSVDYALINYETSDPDYTPFSIDNLSANFSNSQPPAVGPSVRSIPALPALGFWALVAGIGLMGYRFKRAVK